MTFRAIVGCGAGNGSACFAWGLALASLLAVPPSEARAGFYSFSNLVSTGDTIGGKTLTGLTGPAVLNNVGEVAFWASYSGGHGLFTQNALLVGTGDTIGGKMLTGLGSPPSLNDHRDIAFVANYSGGAGIFTANAFLAGTGDTIGGKELTGLLSPSLNNSGDVAFLGFYSGGEGIFTPSTLLAGGGDEIGGKALIGFGGPSINDNGDVAFGAAYSGGSGIFTQHAFLTGTGDTIGGKTLVGVTGTPSLNDDGDLVFSALASTGGYNVFTPDTLISGVGQTISGKTLTGISSPSVNNSGDVIFRGIYSGGEGIFTPNALLAGTGDAIGGKIITGISSPSLNDNGDVAFWASFSDGTTGIVLGTRGGGSGPIVFTIPPGDPDPIAVNGFDDDAPVPGGVKVDLPSVFAQADLTVSYATTASSSVIPPGGFSIPGSQLQTWTVSFDNSAFEGSALLSFAYDESLLRSEFDENSLLIYHTFSDGSGSQVLFPTFIDTDKNILTVEVDQFSDFTLLASAVPEPASFALLALGGVGLLAGKRFRKGRPNSQVA